MALPKLAAGAHGVGWGNWFVSAVADYYLRQIMVLATPTSKRYEKTQKWTRAKLAAHTQELADQMAHYLIIACGGELRHGKTAKCRKILGAIAVEEQDRAAAWSEWEKHVRPEEQEDEKLAEIMRIAAEAFRRGGFRGSFGGPLWARGADYAAAYLDGTMHPDRRARPATLMVEFCLNLHHNTGIIFNKMGGDMATLGVLLGAGHDYNGEESIEQMMLASATPPCVMDWHEWAVEVRGVSAPASIAPEPKPAAAAKPTSKPEPDANPLKVAKKKTLTMEGNDSWQDILKSL